MTSPEQGGPLPPITARDRESYAFGASDHYGDTQIIVQPVSYTDDDWYWYLRGVVEHPVWARGLYSGPLERPYRCSCEVEEASRVAAR